MMTSPQPASKGFSRAFWVSSTVELFERMAYYAVQVSQVALCRLFHSA